jgi:hypothetical protein
MGVTIKLIRQPGISPESRKHFDWHWQRKDRRNCVLVGFAGHPPRLFPLHFDRVRILQDEDTMASKQDLLHFLDRRVFDPILHASPNHYGEADQKKLTDVQDRTRSEKERFHHYRDAQEITENYKRDLHSPAAKRVNDELEHLELPTLPSVKAEIQKTVGEG